MDEFTTENRQIVFVDIVSYSLRTCSIQYDVIIQFMSDINVALNETIFECNKIGLEKQSIVILPSGDGAAIAFPSQQQHDKQTSPFYLTFIQKLLFSIYKNSIETRAANCQKFEQDKYCDCHRTSYFLRFGASIGELVVYKDLNNNTNYAGTPINMAARVMGVAKKANQVALTKEAYQYLNKFYPNLSTPEQFKEYKNVGIKHNLSIDIYQYIDASMGKIGLDVSELDIATIKEQSTLGIASKDEKRNKKARWPKMT